MKQTLLSIKALMMVLMMTIGVCSAWADSKTEGFESATTSTSYQGSVDVSTSNSDCGIGWSIYYGTVSKTSKISGNNSAALRLYTSNNYGYLKTTTPIDNLTNVALKAKAATTNDAAIKVNVLYSTNGTDWTAIKSNVIIASSATDYNWDIPTGGKYFQIAISSSSTKPSSGSAQLTIDDVVFTYTAGDGGSTVAAPTFSVADGTYYSTQSLVLSTTVEGAKIYYTTDGTDPTESATAVEYSSAISVSTTTTIKAAVKDGSGNFSDVITKTYTILPSIANTEATAYTVAEAKALIDANSSQLSTTDVYVKGTVSKVDKIDSGAITYWLDTNTFEVYAGKGIGGADFADLNDIKVGSEVIVKGKIKKFVSTYQFDSGNTLVYYYAPADAKSTATLAFSTYKSSICLDQTDAFTVTYNGDGTLGVASSAEGVATVGISGTTVTVTPVAVGTTTITVSAPATENYTAVEKKYTLTVNKLVAVTIPFNFDGGVGDVTAKGMVQTGLGSDYSTSPKLRFDNTGDELLIRIADAADAVVYTIKSNGFSGEGKFDVLESADNITYTSVASYTTLSTQVEVKDLNSATRFIKFVYTTKAIGNVALGNIKIVNKVSANMMITSAGWATFCSPFDVEIPEGVTAYTAEMAGENTWVKLTEVETPIKAGTPVMLKGEAFSEAKKLNGVPAVNSTTSSCLVGNLGSDVVSVAENQGNYLLQNGSEGLGWYPVKSAGLKVGVNRCYLHVGNGSEVRQFIDMNLDNDETAIKAIATEATTQKDGKYLVNGKFVVVKSGRAYNANGIEIK